MHTGTPTPLAPPHPCDALTAPCSVSRARCEPPPLPPRSSRFDAPSHCLICEESIGYRSTYARHFRWDNFCMPSRSGLESQIRIPLRSTRPFDSFRDCCWHCFVSILLPCRRPLYSAILLARQVQRGMHYLLHEEALVCEICSGVDSRAKVARTQNHYSQGAGSVC